MVRNILIIRLASLGDIVLTSPTVINLKIKYPDSHITYFCKEKYRSVVEMIDGVDEIVCLPEKASLYAFYKLLMELDGKDFNCVVDLHGNFRSWLARKTITADQTVVYPKRRYDRLVAVRKKNIPEVWPHTIDLYNDAVEKLGVVAHCKRPLLKVPGIELDSDIVAFFRQNKRVVVVAPGAAHPTKQWPPERFAQVARRLYADQKVAIIWAITDEDENGPSPADSIDAGAYLKITNYPVAKLAKIVSMAQATIANDSGVAHVSSAVGTPVVTIFGPTHPVLGFAPRGLYDRVIDVDEYCRPCSLHGKKPCYRDRQYCFERVDADGVYATVRRVLAERQEQSEAVFVDRDGTIVVDKSFLSDPDQLEFIDGSAEGLRLLVESGLRVVMISNQSGVARGFFGTDTVEAVNARLMEMLAAGHAEIDGAYYCPHLPDGNVVAFSIKCDCRKPSAGMAEDAAYQLGLDLRKSCVIGDKIDDVNLARVTGARAFMVKTGYGSQQCESISDKPFYGEVRIVDNLLEAAREIVSGKHND